MQGQGIFYPEFYRQFRPFYPKETFSGLNEVLLKRGFYPPFEIADIGCGTGHSSISLLKTQLPAKVRGIDPDPGMLLEASELAKVHGYEGDLSFSQGSAESSSLDSGKFHAVLVGSAFHWMDPVKSDLEFRRILCPKGILRVFEYQFPKASQNLELNEWIRRRFNQDWRAPAQVPRGNFAKVTEIFRKSSKWELLSESRPKMLLSLTVEELVGLILSQSRVFHYEALLEKDARIGFRTDLKTQIQRLMGDSPQLFDFKLDWVEFGLF